MTVQNDIPPPPPPDKKIDGTAASAPDLRTFMAPQTSTDRGAAAAPPKSDINPKEKAIESDQRPDARKDALNRLDTRLDPQNTKGHELLNWLKDGLVKGNPLAIEVKELFGKILFEKHITPGDSYQYVISPGSTKYQDVRIKLELTKADANELSEIVKPKDNLLFMGENGYQGSLRNIKGRIAVDKFNAAQEPNSTFGSIAASIKYLNGGSVEEIRTAGRLGDTVEALGLSASSMRTARDNNVSTGRNATNDLNARRNIPEARPEIKETKSIKPDVKKPIESSNAQRYAFGDNPKTYKDQFSNQEYPIVGERTDRTGANKVDRATQTESSDYNKQTAPIELGGNGKVGIQRPGRINEGGPDSIVYDPIRKVIELRDPKLRGPDSSFPKVDQDKLNKWKNEADRAINGDKNDPAGGCRTGDAKLDAEIRKAWAEGRVELVQINVRGPGLPEKGDYIDLKKFF